MKFKPYLLALAPFLLLILLFELLPLCSIIFKSFMEEGSGGFTFDNYINVFSKPIYRQAIINSITISIISAAVGIVVAFIGAKAAHNTESLMKRVFMSILNMTSNFAGVPLAFSFIILLGKTGVLVILAKALGIESMATFDIYSNNGLILIYIYFQIPLATLLLIPAFNALREEYREAAKILRANSFQYWIHVGLPILMPSLLSTFSVLFANSLVAYGTAYALLSGNASLLPIRISEMFVGDLTQRVELGSALSVVLLLLMALAFGANNMVTRKLRKDVQ
ncbi:ABC transporter permease subunit [Clostridium saudiense]|uniref:ABC transporter permease subunit n=1 Tax=Clostridium saudiense TaxID=1414720 RepID=A0ABS2FFT7_9CLOT|nr:ABC transporter permease subunit [Clostridium saudiense]